MRVSAFPFFWLLLIALPAQSPAAADAASEFAHGRQYYEQEQYAPAVEALERAVRLAPDNAEYQLWLGKAYGRLAQHAGWSRAIELAAASRASLERAVDLAPRNRDALDTLMRFYREAPFFLGGSEAKADALKARIGALDGEG